MSEPSNIRINPFVGDGGTTTYINLTETHIIPSVSPYVIRLNEVPEKQDPSNIRAVWVDSTTGAVTASALTEVAATPAAGEFRPDYSTKADGNDNWNTGLIEFSAVDAGKIVQISYTGMGTLAAVQSNKYPSWYTDRGDGSDGDFMPEADCAIGGIKNYKRVFIKEGVKVSVNKQSIIKVTGSVMIAGTLSGAGAAGAGVIYSIADGNGVVADGNGGGAGGAGSGSYYDRNNSSAGLPGGSGGYDEFTYKYAANGGDGGGGIYSPGGGVNNPRAIKGGGGGHGITIVASAIGVLGTGVIDTSGGDGSSTTSKDYGAGGGGGGGDTILIANIINILGSIKADGGNGGTCRANPAANGEPGKKIFKQLGAL